MSPGEAWFCPPLPRQPVTPAGVKKSFFVPRFPPAPSPPRGATGGLNRQFGCFGPDRDLGADGYGTGLGAAIGKRSCRSEWIGAWRVHSSGTVCAAARYSGRVQGERSERAHAPHWPLGRAEQRSGARIRAGACLSVASLRSTPGGASSARYPAGARPLARLSFAYFSLAKQRKVRPAAGNKQASRPKPVLKTHTQ